MPVNTAHVIAHALASTGGGTAITQITDFAYNAGIAELIHGYDGEVDNTFVAPGLVAPGFTFSTADIAGALTLCGFDGLAISASNILTGYLQKVTQGGLRASATGNHITMVMNEGILIPQTLTVTTDQLATLSMAAIATYDGTNLPVVFTDSENYTASASTIVGWTLGPIEPINVAVPGNTTMTIDFGFQLETLSGDGEGYPTFTYIGRRQPTVTFSSKTAAVFDTLSETGKDLSSSPTDVFLRRVSTAGDGTVRYGVGESEHIKFQMYGSYGSPQSVGGAHGASVDAGVVLTPYYNGTNASVIITTGTTIS
jgi:hypothetical protein